MKKRRRQYKNISLLGRYYVEILGVKISITHKERVLRQVRNFISKYSKSSKNKFIIFTPNPEIITYAFRNPEFKIILNSGDVSIPDGYGLKLAYKYIVCGSKQIQIIKGRELFVELVKVANKKGWRVFLLGDKSGSAEGVMAVLGRSYKKVKLYATPGPWLDENGVPVGEAERKHETRIIERINKVAPEIIFVGFGAPKQEKWLVRNMPKLKFNVGMVVGRSFDFVSGRYTVTPRLFERMRLEWFWRLLSGSQNLPRIFNAVVAFPFLVLKDKISRSDW